MSEMQRWKNSMHQRRTYADEATRAADEHGSALAIAHFDRHLDELVSS